MTERLRGNEVGRATEKVGYAVGTLREEKGWSLQDLSSALEARGHALNPSSLSKLERGKRRIDVDDLVALASALDVGLVRLLVEIADDRETQDAIAAAEEYERAARFWERVSRLVDEDREEFSLPAPDDFEVFRRRTGRR